jgi:hypothetical protein
MTNTQLMPKLAYFLTLFFAIPVSIIAQNLQSPEQFMPHKYPEQFTPHHLTVDYFKHVAAHSDLIQLKEYGRTNQSRPLIYAVISSKENLKSIEQIRQNNLKRTGLLEGKADNSNPITVVWLSMNVHGNEPASSESSVSILHKLVDPNNAETKEWLKNTVVIIDPCVNPDGYHRYTHWYINASDKTPNTSPDAREHREPWPGGRVNHYYFDLNRDWAWASQVETQQRLKIYKEWMPHVVPDFHEMGYNEPYYFAPAAQPYHRYITPFQRDFQVDIGKNHAKYFDKEGWLYFTKEVFDLLYPSYGDTYPTYNGAVGMTYEQGGIGAGRAIQMESGNILTLKDRIAHHITTALSTIEISSKNAKRLCENFESFFKNSSSNPNGAFKTFVVKGSNSRGKIKAFCELLERHQIRFGRIKGSRSISQAYDYAMGKDASLIVKDDDLVISAYQPLSVLTQILLEPEAEIVDSATYDITAWSLPHAFGLETYGVRERLEINQTFDYKKFYLNDNKNNRAYAYVASWGSLNNARFAASLLQKGFKIRAASGNFKVENKEFLRGSLIINRGDNPSVGDRFDSDIAAEGAKYEQDLTPISTGFADEGADLGSGRLNFLQKPNVAIIFDDDVDNNSYGQMWYFFEQDLNVAVTQIKLSDLNRAKLSNYNVICLNDGGYSGMDSGKIDRLKQWATEGGRLILMGDALSAFEDKKGFELTKFANKKDKEAAEVNEEALSNKRRYMHFDEYERDAISDGNPGCIYKMLLDNSHPLGYGMKEHYFSIKTGGLAYQPLKNATNVAYVDDKFKPLGFIGYRLKENLKGTMSIAVQGMRRGAVVYMVDNPLYRGFWYQGKCLFANAVMMPLR